MVMGSLLGGWLAAAKGQEGREEVALCVRGGGWLSCQGDGGHSMARRRMTHAWMAVERCGEIGWG